VAVSPAVVSLVVAAQHKLGVSLPLAILDDCGDGKEARQANRHQSPVTPAAPGGGSWLSASGDIDNDDEVPDVPSSEEKLPLKPAAGTLAVQAKTRAATAPQRPDFGIGALGNDDDEAVVETGSILAVNEAPLPRQEIVDESAAEYHRGPSDVVTVSDSPMRPAKRARASTAPKRLHSFFVSKPLPANAAGKSGMVNLLAERAFAQSRERAGERSAKRMRPWTMRVDPWEASDIATVHVNAPAPCGGPAGWDGESTAAVVQSSKPTWGLDQLDDQFWTPAFAESFNSIPKLVSASAAARARVSSLWSDDVRKAGVCEIDAVNKVHVDSLFSWLKPFYAKRSKVSRSQQDSDASDAVDSDDDKFDGDSAYQFRRGYSSDAESCDELSAENVCLITGDVGCGKSTIVSQAAGLLNLSILEINAMSVRSGKRIKETVAEALATHRIASGKQAGTPTDTQNDGFNTLIVFEEVDCLTGDDRGFWAAVTELSAVASTRRPIVLTANHVTPEMREVFGNLSCEASAEISRLTGLNGLPDDTDPCRCRSRLIAVRPLSAKEVYNAIRAVSRLKGVDMDKVNTHVLTAMYAEGDCRGAINALQFWSLPGEGSVAGRGIVWPELCDRNASEAFTEAAALFRSLQSAKGKLSLPLEPGKTLACWSDALDVFSEADTTFLEPAVEAMAISCLTESGMDVTGPDFNSAEAVSYYYSLAYLRSVSPRGMLFPEAICRGPSSSRVSYCADMRGYIRRMTALETASRAAGKKGRNSGRRTTRSTMSIKSSSFSRLSDAALQLLGSDPSSTSKER
jgi:DNA polymerase III delta prime subunit